MDNLKKLQNAQNLSDVASLLGFKPSALSYILYLMPNSAKYTLFEIPKKNGNMRTIKAPDEALKNLQRRVSNVLNDCIAEIDKSISNNLAHGFKKEFSIQTNAKCHTKKRYVLNIDLKDFFPSFNFGRVRGFFIKNQHFQLNPNVATIIAQIACHDNELPQGSPCSPVISNLISQILDVRMVNVAKKYHCTYSRYADDLTFSTNQKNFPNEIAVCVGQQWFISDNVKNKINRCGFLINESKTRMQHNDRRQSVTGLVVNRKVNVRNEYYRCVRAMLYTVMYSGQYYIKSKIHPVDSGEDRLVLTDMNVLDGMISHVVYTKSFNKDLNNNNVKLNASFFELIRRYHYLKYFGLTQKALIVTEGKTDIGHIKFALMKQNALFPTLIVNNGTGYDFQINFLKHNKKFIGITGGSENLNKVINTYDQIISKIRCWAPKKPVILFVDNDSGVRNIANTIKKKFNIDVGVDIDTSFFHLTKNLYLVKTPHLTSSKVTCIEDFYDDKWLQVKLDGKKFSKSNKSTSDEYAKDIFLKAVVASNYNDISFNKFDSILSRFVEVIMDYDKRINAS